LAQSSDLDDYQYVEPQLDTVSENWYLLAGAQNAEMFLVGFFIYWTYNLSVSSGDRILSPYKEWSQQGLLYLIPYGLSFSIWAMNYTLDHDGGFLDQLYAGRLMSFLYLVPFLTLVGGLYAGSSYAPNRSAIGTDYAIVIQ